MAAQTIGSRPGRTLHPALAVLFLAFCLSASDRGFSGPACAAQSNHAGLVIRFSEAVESHRSWCLGFEAESVSGIEALRLSGLPVVTKSFGSEGEYVCKIGDVGTGLADCPAKDGSYWGYWRMTSQGWRHSGIGASGARVRCGALEGWAWLQGGSGPAPSAVEFPSVCPSAGCKAAPSTVSSPAAGSPPGEQLSGGSRPELPAPGPAPVSPGPGPVFRGRSDSGKMSPTSGLSSPSPLSGPATGSDESLARPFPAGADPPAENARAPSRPHAARGREVSGKSTSWAPYGILSAVLFSLAAFRTYLFYQKRLHNRQGDGRA